MCDADFPHAVSKRDDPITDTARNCEDLFAQSISILEDISPASSKTASSIDGYHGWDTTSLLSHIRKQQQLFYIYSSFIDVFPKAHDASLERRLVHGGDAGKILVSILNGLQRNLSIVHQAIQRRSKEVIDEALDIVDAGLTSYLQCADLMKHSLQHSEVLSTHDGNIVRQNVGFAGYAYDTIRYQCPNLSTSLTRHLARTVVMRRQKLRAQQLRQRSQRRSKHFSGGLPVQTIVDVALNDTAMSQAHNSSQAALDDTVSSGLEDYYADPPCEDSSAAGTVCDYCSKLLSSEEMRDINSWRTHFDRDFTPYVCLLDAHSTPEFFATIEEMVDHMISQHENWWMDPSLRPVRWICDVDHETSEQFSSPTEFARHLQKMHQDYDVEEQGILKDLGETPDFSSDYACPFCAYKAPKVSIDDSFGNAPPSELRKGYESASAVSSKQEDGARPKAAMLRDLLRHFARHVRSISLHSYYDYEMPTDENVGIEIISCTDR